MHHAPPKSCCTCRSYSNICNILGRRVELMHRSHLQHHVYVWLLWQVATCCLPQLVVDTMGLIDVGWFSFHML